MSNTSAIATAERARIHAIVTSAEATGREDLALHLALATNRTAAQAIEILKRTPRAAGGSAGTNSARTLTDLMARLGAPDLRSEGELAEASSTWPLDAATIFARRQAEAATP